MKNQKGFTLVELTVAMVILTTLIVLAGSILLSSTDLFGRNALLNDEQLVAGGVMDFMEEQMVYATKLKVSSGEDSAYSRSLKIDGGHLFFRSENTTGYEDILGEDYYNGFTVSTSVECDTTNGIVKLTVDIYDGSEKVYTTDSTMNLMNISRLGKGGFEAGATNLNDAVISYTYQDVVRAGDPIVLTMQDNVAEFELLYEQLLQELADIDANSSLSYSEKTGQKEDLVHDFFGDSNHNSLLSNDRVRDYLKDHYYSTGWPEFLRTRFVSLNQGVTVRFYQFLQCYDWEVTPYVVTTADGKGIDYVTYYVHNKDGGNWALQLLYREEDGYWYYLLYDKAKPQIMNSFGSRNIAGMYQGDITLSEMMTEIENGGVIYDTLYPGASWGRLEE